MRKEVFDLSVQKTESLRGRIKAPASKSYTLRAIIIGSINGIVKIINPLLSDDTKHAIELWRKLGATITERKNSLDIKGFAGRPQVDGGKLNVGESGTLLRFVLPILALSKGRFEVSGGKTLRKRPNTPIVPALRSWGVDIYGQDKKDHKLPIRIESSGEIRGGHAEISGSTGSQAVSSLLIVSSFLKKDTTIKIKDKLVSRPYVDVTMDVLEWANVHVSNADYKFFRVKKGQQLTPKKKFIVHGDYSSAAFLMAAACLVRSDITITDLVNDKQGDKKFIDILKQMGARIERKKDAVRIRGPFSLKGISVDCSDTPDIVPVLTVLGCFAKGTTRIHNISHLAYKEANRITAPAEELKKLGANISFDKNNILIKQSNLRSGRVSSRDDHRIAMSLAIAGLAIGNLTIKNAHCMSKSYPNFFSDLKSLGANIQKIKKH